MRRLFIVGHPGLYGGAATELHHQIIAWRLAFPSIKLHIIPTDPGFRNEPLYSSMYEMGIVYEEPRDYSNIEKDDAVINFCSSIFLKDLELINERTKRVAWVNCMTYVFDEEKEKAHKNLISHYLYQRSEVRDDHKSILVGLGSDPKRTEFMVFNPYYHKNNINFIQTEGEFTHIGHISRADESKFSRDTLHIYEYILSPKYKRGHFLGWKPSIANKIGKPYGWIKTYENQNHLPVDKFYMEVDMIVQPTDTTENLPRIGFEAMEYGVPLVVDNRGGWRHLIEHGKSGFLCSKPSEFAYWGSRLAFEPELRDRISLGARARLDELASIEISSASWTLVFDSLYK